MDTSWLGLEGKTCVVTGAAGGIGLQIARDLSAAGAKLALLDRDRQGVENAASAIAPGRSVAVCCDVTDPASVAAAAGTVAAELGPCAVLVNNAAVIYADALMDVDVSKWNQLMSVNVTGYLICAQAFGRQMIAASLPGSMIHVASVSGTYPQPYSGAYSVSKAGVRMLSQLLAVELGEHGIRSNVVSPAMVETAMTASIYRDPAVRRRREQIVPARRISRPSDVAEVVLFLAGDRSSYVNGQDILVDGGLSAAWLSMIPRPGFEKSDSQ